MSQTKAQLVDPVDGTIVNADINANAAIAGSKISPDFGSQNIVTTGSTAIGVSSAGLKLHVQDGALASAPTPNSNCDVVIEGTNNTGIQFLSDTQVQLRFGDAANTAAGSIIYNHTDDYMRFSVGAERMRINSSGNVGIGTSSPSTILHVKANTGDMLRLDRDNTGSVGNQIAFRHSNSGTLQETGSINCVSTANADSGQLRFNTKTSGGSNTERMRIDSSGKLSTGGEGNPDVSGGGLCLNQASESTNILTFKSSDIAHGVTTFDETDTYFSARKSSDNKGGLRLHAFTDQAGADPAFEFHGIIASDAAVGYVPFEFRGHEANGTGTQNIAANRRIAKFTNSDGSIISSVTGTGITFGDDASADNALDDYEEGSVTWASNSTSSGWPTDFSIGDQNNSYTKIGNLVTIKGGFTIGNASGTVAQGNYFDFDDSSLPFTVINRGAGTNTVQTVGRFWIYQNLGGNVNASGDVILVHGGYLRFFVTFTTSPNRTNTGGITYFINYTSAQ